MIFFWFCTILLILIASIFIAFAFINPKQTDEASLRDEINKAFFKDRLRELEEENDAGIVGNKDELELDLKSSLLTDIPESNFQKSSTENVKNIKFIVLSVLTVMIVSYGLYFSYGAPKELSNWHKTMDKLPTLSSQLISANDTDKALTPDQMQDLILGLRTTLYKHPDQVEGWLLLGRLGFVNQIPALAIGAMDKAVQLQPEDKSIQLNFAQALMYSNEPADQERAMAILDWLTKQKEVDPTVYSLIAFHAYEGGDYQQAKLQWQKMLDLIDSDDPRKEMIKSSIKMAEKQLQAAQTQTPMTGSEHPTEDSAAQTQVASDGVATNDASANKATKDNDKSAQKGTIKVQIALSDEVKITSGSVLIVSVHDASGSPMPIAAARYPADHFPITVTLDDSDAMMAGNKLSNLQSFVIKARLDTDGDVGTKTGDWYGQTPQEEFGNDILLTINKQF